MNRSDLLLVGLGGGGGRLTDAICNMDGRFQSYFINTSKTDIQTLDNYNPITENFYVIGNKDGMGRDRVLGKAYTEQFGLNVIDILSKMQQKVIWIVSSLGGGSGSSEASVLLKGIERLKEEGDFNKTINAIFIMPSLSSDDIILSNSNDTWNEVINSEALNSIIFVDNDSKITDKVLRDARELEINENFADLFDSLFDVPDDNGINFDEGNLSNMLTNKGIFYIYDLDEDCSSLEIALTKAENMSTLAKPFRTTQNMKQISENQFSMECGYLGISLSPEAASKFDIEKILAKFTPKHETYIGTNENRNLILVSGILPPFQKMQLINQELKKRKEESKKKEIVDFSNFIFDNPLKNEEVISEYSEVKPESIKPKKKKMKKSLFKR